MRALALLGGTFDPVHLGHLRVALEAAELLDAEVSLLPAAMPPHRPPPTASAAARVALLRAALQSQSRLTLDERELRRTGPSYTVDTLRELRAEMGARPLVLLLGADAFAGLVTWHEWRSLFDLAHIGVLTRPGETSPLPTELDAETAPRRAGLDEPWRKLPAGNVLALGVSALDISATRIRGLLAAGRDPRYLVPDAVAARPDLLAPYRHG